MNKKLKETLKHLFATQEINNGWTSFSEKECKELSNYINNLEKENNILKELNVCVGCETDYKSRIDKAIEDIEFCLNSINQEKEMSIDVRTRNEMESCIQILNKTLKTLRGEDK